MRQNIRWIALIAGLAVLCVIALVVVLFLREPGNMVRIYQDGQLLQELPLNEDAELTIPGRNGGYNHVVIQDGQVSVTEANCPDQICVKHIPISHTLEDIVCLPNRLVVKVEPTKTAQSDQVA